MALKRITSASEVKPGDSFAVAGLANPDVRFVAILVLPTGVMAHMTRANVSALLPHVAFVKTEHIMIDAGPLAEHGAWYHLKWSKGCNEAVGLPDGRLFHVESRKAIEFRPAEWNRQARYVG